MIGQDGAPCTLTYIMGHLSLPWSPDTPNQVCQVSKAAAPCAAGDWLLNKCPSEGLMGLFIDDSETVARIIGTTASTVRRWRNGKGTMPTVARLSAIRALGLDYDGETWGIRCVLNLHDTHIEGGSDE